MQRKGVKEAEWEAGVQVGKLKGLALRGKRRPCGPKEPHQEKKLSDLSIEDYDEGKEGLL